MPSLLGKTSNNKREFMDALRAQGPLGKATALNIDEETRVPSAAVTEFWKAVLELWTGGSEPIEAIRVAMEQNPALYRLGAKTQPKGELRPPLAHITTKEKALRHGMMVGDEGDRADVPFTPRATIEGPARRKAIFATSRALLSGMTAEEIRSDLGLDGIHDRMEMIMFTIPSQARNQLRIPVALDCECRPPFRPPSDASLPYGMTRRLSDDGEALPEVLVDTPVSLVLPSSGILNDIEMPESLGRLSGAPPDGYLRARLSS